MADFSDYLFQIKQNATTIYAKNITNLLEKYYEKIFCTVVLPYLVFLKSAKIGQNN